jgi:hypothetical protein
MNTGETMIRFNNYKNNGRVSTARVSQVGGIYREESGLIKVTLINGVGSSAAARVHLLYEPWEWADTQQMLDIAVEAFKDGMFAEGRWRTHLLAALSTLRTPEGRSPPALK